MFLMLSTCYNGNVCLGYENITGCFKNHWTKHRLVCTHFAPVSKLIPNMGTFFNNSDIFTNFLEKSECVNYTRWDVYSLSFNTLCANYRY